MTADANQRANPFPGLRPFRTEEHHLFFGREEQTAALLRLLREHRFLAIVGTSGSGKSSLVGAGLIPALHRGSMARAGTSWEVTVMRPGGHPIASLAHALVEADLYEAEDPEALPRLRATLSRSLYGLLESIRQSSALDPDTNLLVVVDQFEELFRFREQGGESEEAATAFVNLLLAAAQAEDRRIYIAITMRSDYLGDCAQIPGLAEAVNRGEYLIPRLTRDQRRDAIEKPVGVGGAKIAPRLVQHMLNDVGDDPDQLPVLQHALMRTWEAWALDHAAGEPLDLRHYEATGGMAEALSRHADEVFAALPDDGHRAAAERIFKALTVKGADNRGIRRPARLTRLARIVGAGEDTVRRIVDAYRRPGVTFLMPGSKSELSSETVIDLSHESLMRVWRRLSAWVDEEAQSARIYRRLAETAALWERKEAGLYHDPDLQIARTWRESVRPNEAWAEQYGGGLATALSFLDQSRDAAEADDRAREASRQRELEQAKRLAEAERHRLELQKRAASRLRVFASGLAVVAALAVVAFFYAMAARREAVKNADLAKTNEGIAARSAADAKRAAAQLERTLVQSDFEQGVQHLEAGESAEGLPHLARALRTNPTFAPAALRAMSTLSSGRFSLKSLPPIQQERVISTDRWNEKADLLFTSDSETDVEYPQRFVWDARTGERLYAVAPGMKMSGDCAWTKDGAYLVSYLGESKTIQSWEARTGKVISIIATGGFDTLRLGQHPVAGPLVLVRYSDWTMRVFRVATGEPVNGPTTPRLERAAPAQGLLGFSPDGSRVYAACSDATIGIWDAVDGRLVDEISTRPYHTRADDQLQGGIYFSTDSAILVARASDGKHVNWWRIGEQSPAAEWIEFPEAAEVAFLPGGGKVAFFSYPQASAPLRAQVHDLVTRAELARIESSRPVGFAFTLEGRREEDLRFPIIGETDANIVRLWDLETGGVLREIFMPWLLAYAVLAPEGRRVLTVSTAEDVMLWDLLTGAQLWSEPLKLKGLQANFSPDGEKLLMHDSARRLLEIRDARTGRPLREPIEMTSMSSAYFPLGGRRALLYERMSTSMGSEFSKLTTGRFRLLDLDLRPQLFESILDGTSNAPADARYTPDGRTIVAIGRQSLQGPAEIHTFDAGTRRLLRSLSLPPGVSGYVGTFLISPDGQRAVLGGSDARVRIIDIGKGEVVQELLHERMILSAAISADGTLLATGTSQGKLRVWELATGAPLFEPIDHGEQPLLDLDFSPDGALVASASRDFKVRLAESRTGKAPLEPVALNNVVQEVHFCADGAYLAAVPFEEDLPIIEVATGKLARKLHHSDACRTIAFSPKGSVLAVSTGADLFLPVGQVVLWSWQEGRKLGRPLDTKGSVGRFAFSRDGTLLVTATVLDTGGSVQVWDVASGLPVTDSVVGRSGASSVAFRAEATEVVASWRDGTVRIIDLPPRTGIAPERLARLAEAVAGKRLPAGEGGVEDVSREELERLKSEASTGWWQWFFSEADDRTISPGSKLALREYLARLRKSSILADLQDALRLSPNDGLTHARIGLVLLDQLAATAELDRQKETDLRLRRHWENTAAWYAGRAVELEPGNAEAWALQAEVLQRLGRSAEAGQGVARAMELDPTRAEGSSPNAQYLQSLALARGGKWAEADRSFAAALDGLAGEAARADGVPLLGVLQELVPARAPAGYRELKLPAPIPGTFESFDAVPEGQLPSGWTARHEPTDAGPAPSAAGRLDAPESDVFQDWIIVSRDRAIAAPPAWGPPFFAARLLNRGELERVNGVSPFALLGGRFLFTLSAQRQASGVQYLSTPEYDCRGRSSVHAVFHSATEQAGPALTAVEYTVDGGQTWLPVEYRLDSEHVVLDAAGKLDAEATLTKPKLEAPLFFDEAGRPRGTTQGEFIGAKISRALDPHLLGRRRDIIPEGKRIEVYRLATADGQPRVQLRFLQSGRYGWYWAIDNFGLYELPADGVMHPALIDRARDAGYLAKLGLAIAFGTGARPDLSANSDDLFSAAVEAEGKASATSGQAAASAQDPTAEASKRRRLDALLVGRRGLALAPGAPRILGPLANIAQAAGELAMASNWLRERAASEPLHRSHIMSLLSYYRRQAKAIEAAGDTSAATVLDESTHVLAQAAFGSTDGGTLERLAKAGLVAESRVLVRRESEWAYLDTGIDPGRTWKDPSFDDGAWLRGQARLGYGGDGEKTVVSFGSNSREKHITTYFRIAFDVAEVVSFQQLKLSVTRDDGVVVYLNGKEVARDNLLAGEIGPETTATATANDQEEKTFFDFNLAATLLPGRNVIAAEVHQQAASSSDLGFDLELAAIGAIKEPGRDAGELETIEVRLELPAPLRSALWTARAERARLSGDLERAASALERAEKLGPGNPGTLHQRALLQAARGEVDTARATYRAAVEAAIALKAGPRSSFTLLLPTTLKSAVEPIVRLTGLTLAGAARRLSGIAASSRGIEQGWLLAWSEELDRDGHDARLERAETLMTSGQIPEAMRIAEESLGAGPLPAGAPPRRVRERIEWLVLRERCLRRLDSTVEADRVRDEVFAVPPRNPGLGPKLIDLTRHYNASLYDHRKWHGGTGTHLMWLPETLRSHDGIEFDARGLIQLTSGTYPQTATEQERGKDFNAMYQRSYPARVDGIRVNASTQALHFLLAAAHSGAAKQGTVVAQIVIHYEDSSQAEIPLVLGEDLVDWAYVGNMMKVPQDRVAWVGGRPLRVLFRKTWTNPSPEKPIASFDFVSTQREAAPFLLAATAE